MSVVSESADECLREPTKFAREYLSKCQGLFDSRTMGVDTLEMSLTNEGIVASDIRAGILDLTEQTLPQGKMVTIDEFGFLMDDLTNSMKDVDVALYRTTAALEDLAVGSEAREDFVHRAHKLFERVDQLPTRFAWFRAMLYSSLFRLLFLVLLGLAAWIPFIFSTCSSTVRTASFKVVLASAVLGYIALLFT
eukprot:m.58948 g.58948  ORF g.58948 m.58948 type:complete len:193 (-) comp6939_c0_seq1:279-857(-)